MTEASDYSFHGQPQTESAHPRASASRNNVNPSPNQVRRSKRQPMMDVSRSKTPSPACGSHPRNLVAGSHDSLQAPAPSLPESKSSSVNSSPAHVGRSLRMGRKSLHPFSPAPSAHHPTPVYENQIYPAMQNLHLHDCFHSAPEAVYQNSPTLDPVAGSVPVNEARHVCHVQFIHSSLSFHFIIAGHNAADGRPAASAQRIGMYESRHRSGTDLGFRYGGRFTSGSHQRGAG